MPSEPELIDHRRSAQSSISPDDREALRSLSRWMDTMFEVPGLGVRFGLDSLLGLIPGVGDVATSMVSLYILQAAARSQVSRVTMARMGANLLVDWAIGSLPVVGDLFDVYWKANVRNVKLLEHHLDANPNVQKKARRSDALFFAGLLGVLLLAFLGSLLVTYFVVTSLASLLSSVMG